MIYFDNSATTRVDETAAERAVQIMRGQFGNPSSLHGVGAEAYGELGIARNQIAKMLAAKTDCVYFTSGGTESNNLAIQGGARANMKTGRHIVATAIEHDSVLFACQYMEQQGWRVTYVRPDPESHRISAEDVIGAVEADTALVSVMFVNNETGEILPLAEIVDGVRKKNPDTLIHTDCVQGFGKIPFKLFQYDVDMVSASAHKIHGPKGIGALYLRRRDMVEPLMYGGSQEGRISPGTESVPLACAFGEAADKALYRMTERLEQVANVRRRLEDRLLEKIPGAAVNSPSDASPYILNVSLPGIPSYDIINWLSMRQIYVSAGSACSKGAKSHVLQAMGFDGERIDTALRISLSKYNTFDEADLFVNALEDYLHVR